MRRRKIAFAVSSIESSNRFYNGVLGCAESPFRSVYVQEYPLFGHVLVAVQFDGYETPPKHEARGVVPSPNFGVRLRRTDFEDVVKRLRFHGWPFEFVSSPGFEAGPGAPRWIYVLLRDARPVPSLGSGPIAIGERPRPRIYE